MPDDDAPERPRDGRDRDGQRSEESLPLPLHVQFGSGELAKERRGTRQPTI